MKNEETNTTLKYVSLLTLTGQNAILGLSMRYVRTRAGDMFISSTAVVMSELVKFLTCLLLVLNSEDRSFTKWWTALHSTIIKQPVDTLKVCVPSLVYLIQNNLLYVAASNLDVATYQITYQLKILTTAMFAVTMLGKKLLPTQWCSLVVLILGVAAVQLSDAKESSSSVEGQSRVAGFSAALAACCLSGFAGVYFEKILKGSNISVWMRNVQLSLVSLPLGLITAYGKDGSRIADTGFWFGYDGFVWFVVAQNALGGLLVAIVVKYADNILKGFACSLAIIITCVASIFIFNFILSLPFLGGTALVIGSIFLYGWQPKQSATAEQKT